MHKRDVGILLLACAAMVVSLQREGMFSFRKAWYWSYDDQEDDDVLTEHHIVPSPIVADLNGDGRLEVIVANPSLMIQVLSPAPASAVNSGFMGAKLISQVSLLHRTVVASASRRPVAMAVGHIDPAPKANKGVLAPRKQVLVVVTAGLQVLCFDHNLKLLWEKDISGGQLQRHSSIKEVAVLVTPHQVTAGDRGLIVVGASVQKGDLSSGEAVDVEGVADDGEVVAEDDENVLATMERRIKEEAARAHSAGEDMDLEDILDSEGVASSIKQKKVGSLKGLDVSRHFNYHGLEGGSGTERWHHTATDFHKDLPELAAGLRPQNDYRLDAEKLEGRHFGEASCRQYRESVLHSALPHAWNSVLDTRLVEAHFVKHRVGKGKAKENLATKDTKGRRAHATGSSGHGPPGTHAPVSSLVGHARRRTQGPAGAHGAPGPARRRHAHHVNITANALVVHLEEGIEVIHLFTGRTICQLHLPSKELHADINGDGVMDHVQVYRGSDVSPTNDATALAAEAGGARHHAGTHCTALTTSGIPPQHHLWQANVCRTSRFFSNLGKGGGSLLSGTVGGVAGEAGDSTDGIEILTPVFLPLPRLNKGYAGGRHHHGLVVVLNSEGELVALSSKGKPVWQVTHDDVAWTPTHDTEQDAQEAAAHARFRPTLMTLSMHVHGVPGAVLAAGEDGAVVISEHGRELASIKFPTPPSQRLIVVDFNGDGLNDIIELTRFGVFGWAQVQHLGGNTLSMLLAVATAAMGLLIWNNNNLFGAGTGGAAGRKLRSTEYTD